ncbi:hypothetical protein HHI36_021309 [Cryptolaemus montrouzieri]|uniref:DHHA2 domain-containing protein n=1 Tax=Cryptolaemus montrouzieri TaxID=559131 RepID=A0ABD2MX68_9CUCU
MNELKAFLDTSFYGSTCWNRFRVIHIVLGNHTCDLDTAISAIAYGYLLYKKNGLENSNDQVVFPVLNAERKNLSLLLEHQYLLRKAGIDMGQLIYRSDINFEEIIASSIHMGITVKTYLINHHILCQNDSILAHSICGIFDRRPISNLKLVVPTDFTLRIEPVGSCATVIAMEIYQTNQHIWNLELAGIVYGAILLHTKGLRQVKNKTTDQDMEIGLILHRSFNLEEPISTYAILNDLRCRIPPDPYHMLIRDLFCGDYVPIAFPRIHISAGTYIKKRGAKESLNQLCSDKKVVLIVLIGTDPSSKNKDMGVFFDEIIQSHITNFSEKLRENDILLRGTYYNYTVFDRKLTREHTVPIIMKVWKELNIILPHH